MGLWQLLNDNLVEGLDIDQNSSIKDCDACTQAKQTRVPFPKQATSRSQNPGELIHTDVWDLAQTTSWSGMRYNITFIDDCTRYCVCTQLKNKSEAPQKLQQYIVLIQRQYNYISKRICFDKGGEYLSKEFRTWCDEK